MPTPYQPTKPTEELNPESAYDEQRIHQMWTVRFSPSDECNREPIQESETEQKCSCNQDAESSHREKCEQIYYKVAHKT